MPLRVISEGLDCTVDWSADTKTVDIQKKQGQYAVSSAHISKNITDDKGNIDYSQDFFNKETSLTVSGQLNGETYAQAFRNIYTFGPTFRAENSNTTRHAAEFWMIEPEVAFNDIADNMELAEEFLKYLIGYAVENCSEDLEFMCKMWD